MPGRLHPSQTSYLRNPNLTKREAKALLVAVSAAAEGSVQAALRESGIERRTYNRAIQKMTEAMNRSA